MSFRAHRFRIWKVGNTVRIPEVAILHFDVVLSPIPEHNFKAYPRLTTTKAFSDVFLADMKPEMYLRLRASSISLFAVTELVPTIVFPFLNSSQVHLRDLFLFDVRLNQT